MRADVWLVENGIAASRQKAQELIVSGRVVLQLPDGREHLVKKPSQPITDDKSRLVLMQTSEPEFVSRGGLKLLGALKHASGFDIRGATVLDIGISTGGFADCLLQNGAARIVGVDVGHDQLSATLKADKRVILFEGVNARDLVDPSSMPRGQILEANAGRAFDRIVIDVSFISLKLILPAAASLLRESGMILALVKPQFEVGRQSVGKNGLVKDETRFPVVENLIRDACASLGLKVEDYFDSSVSGADGNREFFVLASNPQVGLF
jgi:23S rRNA (cytidine1920-2'-O)/16S rRNA (cytidine1409-2'-O)-methyltransferase